VPFGSPGTCTICVTRLLLPAGTLTLGFGSFGEGGGVITMRAAIELGPSLPAQPRKARTR
jgi:hypothetical protein